MSVVTTIAVMGDRLKMSTIEELGYGSPAPWGSQRIFGTMAKPHYDEGFGGNLCAEADVWLGAYNHLPIDEFLEALTEHAVTSRFEPITVMWDCNGEHRGMAMYSPQHPELGWVRQAIAY